MKTHNKENRASFVYYTDWAKELLKYPNELRLKIDDAVKRYVLYGEEPTDREVIYSMFGLMRTQIDRDFVKWGETREKRRGAANKRWLMQKGANNANATTCMQNMQKDSNDAVNVNVNVNGLSNDNNKEILSKESTKKAGLSLSENPRFMKFNEALRKDCPHVAKMEKQMSCQEFEKALKMFGDNSQAMWDMLRKMENRKGTEKNNRSVYLTLCNWKRREASV